MNKFNALHGKEPNDTPREWKIQPPEAQFKSRTYPPKTSPVLSDIMGRLYHNAIDNSDVEVHPSDFPVESKSKYVPYPDTTPIKSIDNNKMYHLL